MDDSVAQFLVNFQRQNIRIRDQTRGIWIPQHSEWYNQRRMQIGEMLEAQQMPRHVSDPKEPDLLAFHRMVQFRFWTRTATMNLAIQELWNIRLSDGLIFCWSC